MDVSRIVDPSLIALMFEEALAERPWKTFVGELCRRTGAMVVHIHFRFASDEDSGHGLTASAHLKNDLYRDYFRRFLRLNPFEYRAMTPGGVYAITDFIAADRLPEQPLYKEFLGPTGLGSTVCLCFEEPGGFRGFLHIFRAAAEGDCRAADTELCMALWPYLTRALRLVTKEKLLLVNQYVETLEALSIGAMILDRKARIMCSNAIADALVDARSEIRRDGNRLQFRQRERNEVLNALIGLPAASVTRERVKAMNISSVGRPDICAVLKPIGHTGWMAADFFPRAIIYLHEVDVHKAIPQRMIAELFGIAPAEASLVSLLSEGLTIQELAGRLGIAENSARSYLKRIFQKTGISRQADLVRLTLLNVATLAPLFESRENDLTEPDWMPRKPLSVNL